MQSWLVNGVITPMVRLPDTIWCLSYVDIAHSVDNFSNRRVKPAMQGTIATCPTIIVLLYGIGRADLKWQYPNLPHVPCLAIFTVECEDTDDPLVSNLTFTGIEDYPWYSCHFQPPFVWLVRPIAITNYPKSFMAILSYVPWFWIDCSILRETPSPSGM